MRRLDLADADCGIAQALGVVGDWWSLMLVRDVAGGITRFDALQRQLGVSRKVLAERLAALVDHGVLEKRPYSEHPPRHDYVLTAKGDGLLPVLIALQDWGTRHVMGDGSLTATSGPTSAEAHRVEGLVGTRVPPLRLTSSDGAPVDPFDQQWTVAFCFPGAFAPASGGYPPHWSEIPGTAGCTLEARTYAARHGELDALGTRLVGVSMQRPDQLAAFTEHERLPYPMVSDQDARLAAALRLPTFRAAGTDRLKRLTLLIDPRRTVRHVQFPITDPAGSVAEMVGLARELVGRVKET